MSEACTGVTMGRFVSPSDLTAYLACPHLTTLSLEVVLGRRHRPRGREAPADLRLGRRGLPYRGAAAARERPVPVRRAGSARRRLAVGITPGAGRLRPPSRRAAVLGMSLGMAEQQPGSDPEA